MNDTPPVSGPEALLVLLLVILGCATFAALIAVGV